MLKDRSIEHRVEPRSKTDQSCTCKQQVVHPTKAESDKILASSIGVVDGKDVTFQDYFDVVAKGEQTALLAKEGILKAPDKPRGGMSTTSSIKCGQWSVSDDELQLQIDWEKLVAQPRIYEPSPVPDLRALPEPPPERVECDTIVRMRVMYKSIKGDRIRLF